MAASDHTEQPEYPWGTRRTGLREWLFGPRKTKPPPPICADTETPNTAHCIGNKAGDDAFCRIEERAQIERLAAIVHDKRERFRMMAMMNTIGLTPEEAKQQTQAYEIARREMWRAENDLQNAHLRGLFGDCDK